MTIVYGLSGKSGTGKSYHAQSICRENNIDCIVDDGLLIFGNAVIAGRSAKRQATMVGAIKTALFTDAEHQNEVREAILARTPRSVLILGTSDKMILKIAQKLDLPAVSKMIDIEEVTTEKDRELAKIQRKEHGKHVIPAATFQLKRQFSGYFLNPLKILQQKMGGGAGGKELPERSVVRPTYSYLGGYSISDKVIRDIIYRVGTALLCIRSVNKIIITNNHEGIQISADVFVDAKCSVTDEVKLFQQEIARQVEYMTSFNVLFIMLTVRGLV